MPRIAESRPAAEPTSPEQVARHQRILRAAIALGTAKDFERVQMAEVAKDAGVALGTLYRYFPSKTHLFTAVMADQVTRFQQMAPQVEPDQDPVDAVADLLLQAGQRLLARPSLAQAMLQSSNSAHAALVADADRVESGFRTAILDTLGLVEPTARDLTLVRLLIQTWYGVVTSSLTGRLSWAGVEADTRMACHLLLGSRSNAPTTPEGDAQSAAQRRPQPRSVD